MFGSTILDVAIGLMFVYLLLSLMVTASSEIIAAWLKRRNKNLWLGVENLIGSQIAQDFYNHPLIRSLSPPRPVKESPWQSLLRKVRAVAPGPSYIPSRTFAIALLDQLSGPEWRQVRDKIRGLLALIPESIADAKAVKATLLNALGAFTFGQLGPLREFQAFLPRVSDISSASAAKQQIEDFLATDSAKFAEIRTAIAPLLDTFSAQRTSAQEAKWKLSGILVRALRAAELSELLDNIPETVSVAALKKEILRFLETAPATCLLGTDLERSLQLLLSEAGYDPEKFKQNIEIWFNNSMDRVSGWYKRKTQLVNLGLAFLITLCLNVDSVLIFKTLSENSTLRESLVAQATKFVQQTPPPVNVPPQPGSDSGTPKPASSPPQYPNFVLRPETIVSGEPLIGNLTLSNAASADIPFILSTTATNAIVLPSSVVIKAGQSFVEFSVATKPVTKPTRVALTAAAANVPARTAMVALTESPEDRFRSLQSQLENLNLPIGWVLSTNRPPRTNAPKSNFGQTNAPDAKIAASANDVRDRNHEYFLIAPWSPGGRWWPTIRFHFLGWILTAIAVSLGAPVWFDLLNKVITIRSSGKAPEEAPKSPKEVPKPSEPGGQTGK